MQDHVSPLRPVRPDTPEEAAARREYHSYMCGHYERLSALFHQVMIELRDKRDPRSGDYPYDQVMEYQAAAAGCNYFARRERWAALSK